VGRTSLEPHKRDSCVSCGLKGVEREEPWVGRGQTLELKKNFSSTFVQTLELTILNLSIIKN